MATNMDPQLLAGRFGRRLCLHGPIESQYLRPKGTPADVAATMRSRCGILGRDAGSILAPCHPLQVLAPSESLLALDKAGLACGQD